MSIPTAVSPSVKTPGVYVTVNLIAGAASPGGAPLRVALVAPLNSDGNGTVEQVVAGGGADTAADHFGVGSLGHLCAVNLYRKYEQAQVDFVAATAGAGLATLDRTLSGTPSGNNALLWDVMGVEFEVPWLSGESADTAKDRCVDAILQRTDVLAATAVDGGVGVVTVNAKGQGNEGNDIKVKVSLKNSQTGTEAVDGGGTSNPLVGGSTDPDFTNALAALTGKEYAFIATCLSNTDASNTGSKNNFGRALDHCNSLNTGLEAKLQQAFTSLTTTIAAGVASTLSPNSGDNDFIGEMICCVNGRGVPAQLLGTEVGDLLAKSVNDLASNRIGDDFSSYNGSADVESDRPTPAESEQALGGGLSLVSYTANGSEVLVRAITTHVRLIRVPQMHGYWTHRT